MDNLADEFERDLIIAKEKLEIVKNAQKMIEGKEFINAQLHRNIQAMKAEYERKEEILIKRAEVAENNSEMPSRLNDIIAKQKEEIAMLKLCRLPEGHIAVSKESYENMQNKRQVAVLNNIITGVKEENAGIKKENASLKNQVEFLKRRNQNNRVVISKQEMDLLLDSIAKKDEKIKSLEKQLESIKALLPGV